MKCTEKCWAMPECTTCNKTKAPRGRSVGFAGGNSYCNSDCKGYDEEPRSGHLWPGEADIDGHILLSKDHAYAAEVVHFSHRKG